MPEPAGEAGHLLDSRSLPMFAAGAVDVPWVIQGMDELVSRDTVWEAHAHPTHELLWNLRGASSATTGTRTWTITPTLGLWVPAGVPHSGRVPAGTWYRAAQFSTQAVSPLSAGPVAIEITPLLTLLLDRLVDRALGSASRSLTEQMVLDVLTPSPHELFVQQPRSDLLRPIAAALTANPADPRTLSAWAEHLGVSPRTITRAFRAETGLSFARWQAVVRAQQAVLLLARGGRRGAHRRARGLPLGERLRRRLPPYDGPDARPVPTCLSRARRSVRRSVRLQLLSGSLHAPSVSLDCVTGPAIRRMLGKPRLTRGPRARRDP